MINRFMRLIVMFDLPVVTVEERQIYSKFRKFLLKDGYIMMQFSIYSRICKNGDDVSKHINRIRQNLPDRGNIRLLQVTEKQYQDMILLCGRKVAEEEMSIQNLIVFE